MNQRNHTPEQYQLSLHIAALETVINYAGPDMPEEAILRLTVMKKEMMEKIKEINLSVTPQDLFNHIASFYEIKH